MVQKIRNKKIFFLVFSIFVLIAFVNSCKKDEEPEPTPPANPYDNVDYGTNSSTTTPPDPNSFVGIHNNILRTRCAMPGCHDGNFEPDFRTVQSAYATLVWHKIVKNSLDSSYTFRVVPYDTAKSVLYKRITICNFADTSGCDRMPQDNIGVPLPQDKVNNIVNWILNGAKDMFGNSPAYPNTEPRNFFYYATNQAYNVNFGTTENRMDSIYYNPFYLNNNTTVNLVFVVEDDSTSLSGMTVKKLKISQNADDFSAALIYNATYVNFQGNEFHLVTINTATLPNSDTLFMRYYVNDGDHTNDTYFPTDNLPFPYKTYWSFYIKP